MLFMKSSNKLQKAKICIYILFIVFVILKNRKKNVIKEIYEHDKTMLTTKLITEKFYV